ncbi:MAG: hypothetical protein EBR09_01255 [Proteobacteria bacterium]|nr:hypothetical protein [Pseudomonadota bacterium]
MASIATSGIVWMAIAGIILGVSSFYAAILWRGSTRSKRLRTMQLLRRRVESLTRTGRTGRLTRFENIAKDVLCDVESALQPPLCTMHARSFLPILSDVRKRGQILLQQQTTAHRVAFPDREKTLNELVMRLFVMESKLKALPKPTVTIEEVLSGKFE